MSKCLIFREKMTGLDDFGSISIGFGKPCIA